MKGRKSKKVNKRIDKVKIKNKLTIMIIIFLILLFCSH